MNNVGQFLSFTYFFNTFEKCAKRLRNGVVTLQRKDKFVEL